MRVFFGIELDSKTVLDIAGWRERELACLGRAVPPANFHITLAFVGEIGNLTLERLCLLVDEWLAAKSVFGADFELDQVGYWPKPGIYWLGCANCPQQLSGLAERLKGITASVGGKRDRKPFQPHVTLYRRCSGAPAAPSITPSIRLSYRNFSLFESIQGKSGVSYRVLQDWDLQAGIS